MKVSVVIPTYNAERTIRATLASVFHQTAPPHEILVLDDGSTDDTVGILQEYESHVSLSRQENRGVAAARNALCYRAQGDLVAFLDHDDIWHPRYLQVQQRNAAAHPDAVAFFTGHTDFYGHGDFDWPEAPPDNDTVALIDPKAFLAHYCSRPGPFASVSFLCVPKRVLSRIGSEPFRVDGADDSYLCTLFPLFGPIAYSPGPLVAYRFTEEAQSSDSLKMDRLRIDTLELLESRYRTQAPVELTALFEAAYASKQRQYAKRLLGAGREAEARKQLRASLARSQRILSTGKSIGWLIASYMPGWLQPTWPSAQREWRE